MPDDEGKNTKGDVDLLPSIFAVSGPDSNAALDVQWHGYPTTANAGWK